MASSPSSVETAVCRLCSLAIRIPVYERGEDKNAPFCCSGCRNVWRILIESGQLEGITDPCETSLYKQALAAGLIGEAAEIVSPPSVAAVNEERKGSTLDDQRQCILKLDGMWCSSCSWLIAQTLLRSRGVVSADVSFASDTARVIYKPAKTDQSELVKAVTRLGYSAAPLDESNDKDPRVLARRREFLRVVISIAFTMNVMMLQLILYAGHFEGIAPSIRRGLPWLLFTLSLPVIYSSRGIFLRALFAAKERTATMDTLVSLGSGAAFAYSIWQMFASTGNVYFDTGDMLLGLVMVGKFIETGVRQNATDALSLLYGLLPKKAILLKNNKEYPVTIAQLDAGDTVFVKSAERIPADGSVLLGSGMVDESLLSGESRPVEKQLGDHVIGGTMLQTGALTVTVTRTGEAGKLNQIISLVADSLSRKTPAERLADRISRVFVPTVLLLACVAAAFAIFMHGGLSEAISRVVAVLVIACPCALGIATPMAISAGVAYAAQSGILVADGGAFETLSKVTAMVLDKTGTATEGTFQVQAYAGDQSLTQLLVAIEQCSSHPVANAIRHYFTNSRMPSAASEVSDYRETEGVGITGTVATVNLFVGNERSLKYASQPLAKSLRDFADEQNAHGFTVVYWGIQGGNVLGAIGLGDRVRPEAASAIQQLKRLGVTTELVSGDSAAATEAAAKSLAIQTWQAGALPAEKAVWVEKLIVNHSAQGKVCMVGDGVNDAPALARADVGIALASGNDIAARTSQVTLLKPDLSLLPQLIVLSRRTVAIVRQNLFWAFLYNLICIPLAMAGFISPIWAVAAMLVSSFTVILNTQRLKK